MDAYDPTPAALLQQDLEFMDEVFGLFLDLDIAIPDNSEDAMPQRAIARKQHVHEGRDDALEAHEADRLTIPVRQANEARREGRHGHKADHRFASALRRQLESDGKAEIWNEWKWMGRIDRLRRQDWKDMAFKMITQPAEVGLGELSDPFDLDFLFIQQTAQLAPTGLLGLHQFGRLLFNGFDLLGRCHAILAGPHHAGAKLLAQARIANHEKFIEVIRGDGQKTKALKQWMRDVVCFFQHPLIELQPGQLPVQKSLGLIDQRLSSARRRLFLGRCFGRAHGLPLACPI